MNDYNRYYGTNKIIGIKYPAEFDIESADFSGCYINESDFSLVKGLRWRHIKNAIDISSIKYPADFDIENADFSEREIHGSDFRLLGLHSTGFEPVLFEKDTRVTGYEPVLVKK